MTKPNPKVGWSARTGVFVGLNHGLGQSVSVTGGKSRKAFPDTTMTAHDALKGDWKVLGGDMRIAVGRVAASGAK